MLFLFGIQSEMFRAGEYASSPVTCELREDLEVFKSRVVGAKCASEIYMPQPTGNRWGAQLMNGMRCMTALGITQKVTRLWRL